MRVLLLVVFVTTLIAAPVMAQQGGVVVRTATVYSKTSIGSEQVGELAAGTRVNIFTRRGGWKEVFAEDQAIVGWVRGYQVREGNYAPPAEIKTESDSRGFLSGLASFSRKASGFFSGGGGRTSEGTATIGVRGLSEEQIRAAQPDFDQFEKMQSFVSDQRRVKRFARKGELNRLDVEHIKPEPEPKSGFVRDEK